MKIKSSMISVLMKCQKNKFDKYYFKSENKIKFKIINGHLVRIFT